MEEQETIVIDVKINEADIRQRLGEVNTAIRSVEESNKKLKASMKENGDELGINSQLLAQNEALLKSLKAEQSALSGQVRASMQSYQKYGTSIKELTAKMNALKEEYKSLTREQREGAEGNALKQQIAELKQEIDEANHSLGDFHDNVGNYPGAVEPVTAQIKELTQALIAMKVAGQEGTEEYQTTLQRLGELKDAAGDAQQEIKNMASDTSNLDSVLQGAQATAGAFSAALGVMNLLGASDSKTAKELAAAQQKLQAAIAITTGLQSVQNALQKQSALMMGIQKIQTLAAAKAQDAYTAATGRATIAQRIFNFVAKQNPYVLLAMAIVSVVGAIAAFTRGSKEQEKQVRNTNNELNNHLEVIKYLQEQYRSVNEQVEKNIQSKIDEAKATGQSTEAIRAAEDALYEERMKNLKNERKELGYGRVEMAYYEEQYTKAMDNIKILEENRMRALKEHDEESEIYFINEINRIKQMGDYYKTLIDNYNNVNNAISDLSNQRKAQLKERDKEDEEARKAEADRAKTAAEKHKEIEENKNQALRKLENEFNKMVIEGIKKQQKEYTVAADKEIRALEHRLETERNLTAEQRAKINQEIIDLEQSKNDTIAAYEKEAQLAQLAEQHRLDMQAIEDELKELEKSNALKGEKGLEIKAKYDQLMLDKEKEYEEKRTEIANEYTDKIAEHQLEATEKTLQNEEDKINESYDRREQERDIRARKRLALAGENERDVLVAEFQNLQEEYTILEHMDEETKAQLFASDEEYFVAKMELKNKLLAKEKEIIAYDKVEMQNNLKAVATIYGALSDFMGEFSEENEALAEMEKVLGLAKIAISTGVAISEGVAAASAAGGYPANLVAIATTVATVLANMATAIKLVKGAKFAEGGIVDGDKFFGDKIHAQLNSGEMVLNREQQANLFRMIKQPQTIGSTAELTEAFSAALSEMPNPVLDYTEFRSFTNSVDEMTNKTIIR